jgi:peptide/nickel transport system substrate-binding protein
VKSLQPGRSITVVPNAGYWGTKAKPSSVTFTYAPDPSQRLALVQSGAADIGVDLGPSQADLAAAAKLKVLRIGTTLKLVLFQFTKGAPLNNINNRKAIALAIDRNKITTGIFRGKARPDGGLLNVIPGTKPATQVNANPAEARKLVQGSPTVTLNYPTDRYPLMPEVAQAIGQMLEDVGFKVKLDPTSYISGVVKVLGGTMSGLWITGAVPNVPDSNFLAQGFLTSTSITKNCIDKRFDVLTAKALTLKDEKAAKPVYEAMHTLAVSRLACFVPLYGAITNVAMRNNVNGFVFSPLNTMYWDKVTLG